MSHGSIWAEARAVLPVPELCFYGLLILQYGTIWYTWHDIARYGIVLSIGTGLAARIYILNSSLLTSSKTKPAYASSSSAASPSPFPNIFATTGVSATVGGNLMGDAALCAA